MELITLKAKIRSDRGKNAAHRTRAEGALPAVLYGGEAQDAVPLSIDAKQFGLILAQSGVHAVVQIDVADNPALSTPTLVKEVQRHPVREHLLHADFMRIRLDERIQTAVPVQLVGHTKGVVEGGVLEHFLREIEVECLALEVPEFIEIDTTDWEIGHSCHVADVPAPEGVTILTEPDRTIAAIHTPRVVTSAAEDAEAAEEAAAEAAAEAQEAEEGEG